MMKRISSDKLAEQILKAEVKRQEAEAERGEPFPDSTAPVCPHGICDGYGNETTSNDSMRSCRCQWEKFARARLRRARIPSKYKGFTLDSFVPYDEQSRALYAWVREKYLVQFGPDRNDGLVLWGLPGRGKSHIAVAILQELVLNHNQTGLFMEWGDLLNGIRRSYSSEDDNFEHEFLDALTEVDVLLIDDMGAQRKVTQWAYDQAFHLVSTRARNNKTLIITSMLEWQDEEGASEFAVKLSYAVWSKLSEVTFPIGFNSLKHYRDRVTPEKVRAQDSE